MWPYDIVVDIRMSLSPTSPKAIRPSGSFLWQVEPGQLKEPEKYVCWRGPINTEGNTEQGWNELRINAGERGLFQLGYHRIMQKAGHRIADVLNEGNANSILLASFGSVPPNFDFT